MNNRVLRADPAAARLRATELLAELGIDKAPVPIERIIKKKQITLRFAPFEDDLSGMAFIDHDQAVIGVNSQHAPNRQRFTAAHELGHHLLHASEITGAVHVDKGLMRGVLLRNDQSSQGVHTLEIDANAFASELLMPRDLLVSALDGQPVDIEDDEQIEALSKKFKVSVAAMRFRLSALMSEATTA